MQLFIRDFSNREIALFIWMVGFIFWAILQKKIRASFFSVIKAFLAKKLVMLYLTLIIYTSTIIWTLYKIRIWDYSLLKDTIFWFFGIAMSRLLKAYTANDNSYFKSMLIGTFKWTVFIEFVGNLESFSLITEIILVPILFLLFMLNEVSGNDAKDYQVKKLLTSVRLYIGVIILMIILYKTIIHYKEVFTIHNVFSLFLPGILTFLYVPFIYFTVVYFKYNSLYSRINSLVKDKGVNKDIKNEILKTARFNLYRLNVINKGIMPALLDQPEDINGFIKDLIK